MFFFLLLNKKRRSQTTTTSQARPTWSLTLWPLLLLLLLKQHRIKLSFLEKGEKSITRSKWFHLWMLMPHNFCFCNVLIEMQEVKGFNFEDLVTKQDPFGVHVPCVNGLYTLHHHTSSDITAAPLSSSSVDDNPDFSETTSDMLLHFIDRILNEEDIDDKIYVETDLALQQATEKYFSDVLRNPLSPDQPPLYCDSLGSPDDSGDGQFSNSDHTNGGNGFVDVGEGLPSEVDVVSIDHYSQSLSGSFDSRNGIYWTDETRFSAERIPDFFFESQPVWQFNKGVEEASKFLPDQNKLAINVEFNGFVPFQNPQDGSKEVVVKVQEEENSIVNDGSRGRKNPHHENFGLEDGRSSKQSAISSDDTLPQEMFDKVLLGGGKNCKDAIDSLREAYANEISKNMEKDAGKDSSGRKSKGKKQTKRGVVDLRTLLIHCAQSIAADDRRSAYELLKQIRQHSSNMGDGSQRLAHCFANGLEARLAGTGSQTYHTIMETHTTAATILKAYQVYMAACPFKKISYFYSSQKILNASQKTTRLHIIDFGIGFGFQWPCFMQELRRTAGPDGATPMLRITAIDRPQPGLRPTERIEDTGRRLKYYAQRFDIQFEYHHFASRLETVEVEDLKIRKDELVVVNCLYNLENLADETVMLESPRDIVLNKIRKINPHVFIHGINNGSYSAPFFVTRFREALFHFTALFDIFECTIPRDLPERECIERELFGREALNIIACEGIERVHRPETYKQWQVRNQRAGLKQLPVDPEILKKAKDKFQPSYNKEFVIDDDGKWLLQGWKGRIIYALSTWRSIDAGF